MSDVFKRVLRVDLRRRVALMIDDKLFVVFGRQVEGEGAVDQVHRQFLFVQQRRLSEFHGELVGATARIGLEVFLVVLLVLVVDVGVGVDAVDRRLPEDARLEQRVLRPLLLMVVGTVGCFVTVALLPEVLAIGLSVLQRVVFVLFPPMRLFARVGVFAPVFIIHEEGLTLPQDTLLLLIVMMMRRSAEILPIVAIITRTLVMFELVERTEDRLEVEHEEVPVLPQEVNERHLDLSDLMGEGTEDRVLTISHPEWELVTEFGPVFNGPV